MRCTNNVIHKVTGKMAKGYNLNIILASLGVSRRVLSWLSMSKTRFCAVGIEPSTSSTSWQTGSLGRTPRALRPMTRLKEIIGIKNSLTKATAPRILVSVAFEPNMLRSHCVEAFLPFNKFFNWPAFKCNSSEAMREVLCLVSFCYQVCGGFSSVLFRQKFITHLGIIACA